MKRNRIVLLGGQILTGEEIEPTEFPELETFRRQAARWEGPENVLVLRNARLENGSYSERLDYLLLKRDAIEALGTGTLSIEGFVSSGLER
ncbi:MAG: hypothetical protein IVW51_12230 [Thermaceae bacterium]|nr:hypothetical protein [Thermaceae bacterium]